MRCTIYRDERWRQRYEHKPLKLNATNHAYQAHICSGGNSYLPRKRRGMKKEYVYISRGSCVRASKPLPRTGVSVFVTLRAPNPPMPGPRGCLMTPLLEASFKLPLIEPITLEGRLGTGGIELPPKVVLPNKDPKPPGERRAGEAMVA